MMERREESSTTLTFPGGLIMRERQMTREIKIKKIVQFMSLRRKWSIVQVKNKTNIAQENVAANENEFRVHFTEFCVKKSNVDVHFVKF